MTARAGGPRETFFASCSPGLEPFLLREARALKLARAEGQPGGLAFTGPLPEAWRANLWLRTASRVHLRLARFPAATPEELYAGARAVDLSRLLRPDGRFEVSARSRDSRLDHEVFVAQKVKDAVADRFREEHGRRPSVDLEDPDLRLVVHLSRDRCTLMADTSGESLHKRGWRRWQGTAPLKETVAAGILMASGWDGRAPLLDPFCGSGTILVEGAMLAGGLAPGRWREEFAFQRWPVHDAAAYAAVRDEARAAGSLPGKLTVLGTDVDPQAVAGARANVEAAGFADRVAISVADAGDFAPRRGWNACVVTNPPWGERVGEKEQLPALYRRFGEALRRHAGGYTIAVLGADPHLLHCLALPEVESFRVKHGDIDCRLAVYRASR